MNDELHDRDIEIDIDDLRDQMHSITEEPPGGDHQTGKSTFTGTIPRKKIIAGVLLICVLVVFFIARCGNDGEMTAVPEKTSEITVETNSAAAQIEALRTELSATKGLLAGRIDELTEEVRTLREALNALPAVPAAGVTKVGSPGYASPAPAMKYHTVRRGQTLTGIAGTYGMSVNELCRLNGISPKKPIYPGQRLTVRQ